MTYAERVQHDAELRAFVEGEIARAGIDVQAARVECLHKDKVIAALEQQVALLKQQQARWDAQQKEKR